MSDTTTIEGPRQRLGRRLGLEPYYVVAERAAGKLRLESRPEANRGPGLRIIGIGVTLIVIALVVAGSGLFSAATGSGFAVAAMAAALGGLLGALGYQRALGGYAVLTTRNSIVCDAEAATLTFRQGSKVGAPRSQALRFSQVSGLRLRQRPLQTGWPIGRVRPIVAIELIVGEHIWVVDTSADPEALRPAAEGLSEILGREFERG